MKSKDPAVKKVNPQVHKSPKREKRQLLYALYYFCAQEKYAQISWFVIWSLLYQLMSHITCLSHYARHNHINLMANIINT